jgi:hypothetical protein
VAGRYSATIFIQIKINNMTKQEALQAALDQIKEYGFISEDGILDLCDEDNKLVSFVHKQLAKMVENGELSDDEYSI